LQNLIFENQRFKNKIVSEFLFGQKDMKSKELTKQNDKKENKIKDDDMDFDDDNKYKKD
jgi:hypothetical protein